MNMHDGRFDLTEHVDAYSVRMLMYGMTNMINVLGLCYYVTRSRDT